ncbi:hypothetical protein MXZ18_06225 [Streptococcus uberis]|uniref:hypothetical protein n=1 Tax=Streptococcus uberis TaxID=1349 RepID=UPI0027DC4199|nr:hypothetical protein [Streptococcus uberis]MCK1169211.1 hypothetical protein [Streptococcus uberis]
MIATIERHLSLYFKQKASIFFSLLGALIAFFLYIIFLQKKSSLVMGKKVLAILNPIWIFGLWGAF